MSTKISIHKDTHHDANVELQSTTYDKDSGSAIRFHTIDLTYSGTSVVLFMNDDESLIDALHSIIRGAEAKLNEMMALDF